MKLLAGVAFPVLLALCSGPGPQPSQPTPSPVTAPPTASPATSTPNPQASPESGRGSAGYGVTIPIPQQAFGVRAVLGPISTTVNVPSPPQGDPNQNAVWLGLKAPGTGPNCGNVPCGSTLEGGVEYWTGYGYGGTAAAFRVEDHSVDHGGFRPDITVDAAFIGTYAPSGSMRVTSLYVVGVGSKITLLNARTGAEDVMATNPELASQITGGWVLGPETPTWSNTLCVGLPTITARKIEVTTDGVNWAAPGPGILSELYAGPCTQPSDATFTMTPDGFTWTPLQ